ncbi:MYB DNA-binding domain protein [Rasamsonia emersonii CBS 393.64]|uniref:MYB DNA-binding domain protein n=1 Tax=Rasamsonia emersonii (strain ATCC 16479 / CBS 393.64 / IMI 116815) TaxID=1408163 RepID=A0A0F4YFT6_RASE3|nr:MYB DNA-binding domain protein [Rasamsonia emersonii CBS 393.64]KKA16796.1 MYB DNA-binding domain protein [Rasamsonia emersonii CBS 393.64]
MKLRRPASLFFGLERQGFCVCPVSPDTMDTPLGTEYIWGTSISSCRFVVVRAEKQTRSGTSSALDLKPWLDTIGIPRNTESSVRLTQSKANPPSEPPSFQPDPSTGLIDSCHHKGIFWSHCRAPQNKTPTPSEDAHMILIHPPQNTISPAKVDISLLLKRDDEEEAPSVSAASSSRPSTAPVVTTAMPATTAVSAPAPTTTTSLAKPALPASAGTKRLQPAHSNEPPAKKQSKWSPEEDALIIELRGRGMKWEDISKRLPGRSAISCRLHYQNYLERRSEWDEDRKNKLARLYERFKAEMWSKVAEEMAIPWRAAEAMHWQLGEQEMARRAGVVPFSLSSGSGESASKARRSNTVMPRLRRPSVSQRPAPPQLPSVEELTAGVPAYSSPLTRTMTQPIVDPYRMTRPPPPLNISQPGDLPGADPGSLARTRP